jgi:integral membrane sensor domain MASE1
MKNDLTFLLGKSLLGLIRQVRGSIVEDHMNLLTRIGSVWVPSWSSTAVTCGIAAQWSWGMIVGRGGTIVVSDLPAGQGLAGTAVCAAHNQRMRKSSCCTVSGRARPASDP